MTVMGVIALICQTKMTMVLQNEKKEIYSDARSLLLWKRKLCATAGVIIQNVPLRIVSEGHGQTDGIHQARFYFDKIATVNFAGVDLYFILNYLGPKAEENTCVICKKKKMYISFLKVCILSEYMHVLCWFNIIHSLKFHDCNSI